MSKLKAKGNDSGTGVFTLETPPTNTDRTLTLPDTTGTLVDTTGATFTGGVTGTDVTLSGGLYVGGTGSANYLDDYETGTWTPTTSVGGITNYDNARYTKIGNRVFLMVNSVSFNNAINNETLEIKSLPFTPAASQTCGSAMWSYTDSANSWGAVHITAAGLLRFYQSSITGGFDKMFHSDLNSTSASVYLHAVYYTTA